MWQMWRCILWLYKPSCWKLYRYVTRVYWKIPDMICFLNCFLNCCSVVSGVYCRLCKVWLYWNGSYLISACQCNQYGTVNGSLNCHQVTGQCSCKENIDQRTCSQCELGYYKFPNTTDGDCFECVCDSGGTTPDFCEKDQGKKMMT